MSWITEHAWWMTAAGAILAWAAGLVVNRRGVRRFESSGDAADGIVLFVEPVRWLFVIWGFASFCRGLRRAGGRQMVRLFRWSSPAGALLVIPDLVHRSRLHRKAERLARTIDRMAILDPAVRIHLVGYSSGAYVALEACKLAGRPASLGRLILLAPSMSSRYDWADLPGRIGEVHSFHSRLDLINLLGPLLFGSNDRRWGPASGVAGFDRPPAFVTQRAWSPADAQSGYFGDHFTVTSAAFVAEHIAPLLAPPAAPP